MRYPRLTVAAAAIVFVGIAVGYALAQTAPVIGKVDQVRATADLFLNVVGGTARVPGQYASSAQINAAEGVQYVIPLEGFSVQINDAANYLYLDPAGALNAGSITLPVHPTDGQHVCLQTGQTVTTPTYAAGTASQTLSTTPALPTVVTAAVQYCFRYIGPTATWYYTATG